MTERLVTTRLHTVFFGTEDSRIRATWRFLLAWPLLPLVGALVGMVMPVLGLSGMIPGGPLQGIIFLGLLLVWARYIDRRPLSDYGVSASPSWLVNLFIGFGVVVGVWSGWHLLASSVGWMQIEWSMTVPQESVLFGLGGVLVSLVINTWVQDAVFFAIVLASAAEGLHSRNIEPAKAVVGAWMVAVLFFTAIHGTPTILDAVATAAGGAVFGLLYVHTGNLALTIGVHWGASYAAGTIFVSEALARQAPTVFQVSQSLPGDVGGAARILLYLVTYLALLGWLRLHQGEVTVDRALADWHRR